MPEESIFSTFSLLNLSPRRIDAILTEEIGISDTSIIQSEPNQYKLLQKLRDDPSFKKKLLIQISELNFSPSQQEALNSFVEIAQIQLQLSLLRDQDSATTDNSTPPTLFITKGYTPRHVAPRKHANPAFLAYLTVIISCLSLHDSNQSDNAIIANQDSEIKVEEERIIQAKKTNSLLEKNNRLLEKIVVQNSETIDDGNKATNKYNSSLSKDMK